MKKFVSVLKTVTVAGKPAQSFFTGIDNFTLEYSFFILHAKRYNEADKPAKGTLRALTAREQVAFRAMDKAVAYMASADWCVAGEKRMCAITTRLYKNLENHA